jgi:hypothetical protein
VTDTTAAVHLTPEHRVADLLRHPAFQGHASLLLPWDDRTHDETMPLAEIHGLLPYHSHVQPKVVLRDADGNRSSTGSRRTEAMNRNVLLCLTLLTATTTTSCAHEVMRARRSPPPQPSVRRGAPARSRFTIGAFGLGRR